MGFGLLVAPKVVIFPKTHAFWNGEYLPMTKPVVTKTFLILLGSLSYQVKLL